MPDFPWQRRSGTLNVMQQVDETWLTDLRCPHNRERLHRLPTDARGHLNERIRAGQAFTRLGMCVTEELADGLITSRGDWVYAICDGVPQLVAGEAIRWEATPGEQDE